MTTPENTPFSTAKVERLGIQELVDSVTSASPHLAQLLVDTALGAVMARPALDLRTRELIAVALLAAQGADPAFLSTHARAALGAGAEAGEVVETLMQVATFAGFPRALHAFEGVREELDEAGTAESIPDTARSVVSAFFERLTAGDVDGAVELCDPEAVWSIPGDPGLLPWAGQHRGREAIRAFYALLAAETEVQFLDLGPVIAHAGRCYVRGEFGYRFPRSGGAYEGAFVIVFTVDNGAISHYEMHEDSHALAAAFGQAS